MLSFYPRDVLDETWYFIESVSEGFPIYSCESVWHIAVLPFLYMQLTIYMQLSGIRYPCTRSTFANHMLSLEERLWYNSKRRHLLIYYFCDFETLCLIKLLVGQAEYTLLWITGENSLKSSGKT